MNLFFYYMDLLCTTR